MHFLDVCGPPGVGKSALCDEAWPANSIHWDGQPWPFEWQDFATCAYSLLDQARHHPSHAAIKSLMARSLRKMGTVSRMPGERVYIQTGFAQRGLDLGRMLGSANARRYWELMPVSVGVALLYADLETISRRNAERPKQDRAFMVDGMLRARETAIQVFRARGVPFIEIDTREPIAANKARLLEMAGC